MEHLERTLHQLIDDVYHAAAMPHEWPTVLQNIAQQMGACNTLIYCFDAKKSNLIQFEQSAFGCIEHHNHRDYFRTLDSWNLLWDKVLVDRAYTNLDVVDYSQSKNTEIYSNFGKTQDYSLTAGGIFLRDDHYFGIACFQIPKPASQASKNSYKILEYLMPHLRRALQLQRRIANQRLQDSYTHTALDQLPYGVILLRTNSVIDYCNTYASSILDKTKNLIIDNNNLLARPKETNAKLQLLINQCFKNSGKIMNSLTIESKGTGFIQLYIFSFRKKPSLNTDGIAPIHAAIFLLDPSKISLPSISQLNQMLGISKTESSLARGLYQGKNINQISEERGVTINTTRSQIKSIFKKTGVHSKSQLIRRMHDIHRLISK